MMSKEFAREKIQGYLAKNGGILPIEDAFVWQTFTFKELLCIAYDLEKNRETI
jgi:hypothetical protein